MKCLYEILPVLFLLQGNGECNLNSGCDCFEGFTGGVCECTTANATCMRPGADPRDEGELCSGEGQCICGSCVCNNYSMNFGQFCEDCLVSMYGLYTLLFVLLLL